MDRVATYMIVAAANQTPKNLGGRPSNRLIWWSGWNLTEAQLLRSHRSLRPCEEDWQVDLVVVLRTIVLGIVHRCDLYLAWAQLRIGNRCHRVAPSLIAVIKPDLASSSANRDQLVETQHVDVLQHRRCHIERGGGHALDGRFFGFELLVLQSGRQIPHLSGICA